MSEPDHEVLIVGAGLSGIGMAIKLRKHGFTDFKILEKEQEFGGTWRDNVYPGITVDVPTVYYSFSFELNSEWSTFYAPQSELLRYCLSCATKYKLYDHVIFGVRVVEARFDAADALWYVSLADGSCLRARYLISGTGLLSVPRWPDIPGIEGFGGVKMHTMHWDHSLDLTAKRVGFIGTGATGVQVIPEVAPTVGHLFVYQRTPTWIMPKPDRAIGPRLRWAMRHVPGFQRVLRWMAIALIDIPLWSILASTRKVLWLQRRIQVLCLRKLEREVRDPKIRAKLTPLFDFGCRRPTFSNKYLPAFNLPSVELITAPIERISAHSIVTQDGEEQSIDVLVCATGFHVFTADTVPTFKVIGREGVALSDYWAHEGHQSHRGVCVNNFPNYFMVFGPNSVSSLSYIQMIEASTDHIIKLLRRARVLGADVVEVQSEVQAREYRWVQRRAEETIWIQGDCGGSGGLRPGKASPVLRPNNTFTAWLARLFVGTRGYRFTGQRRPCSERRQ